jgi:hypothetical protein
MSWYLIVTEELFTICYWHGYFLDLLNTIVQIGSILTQNYLNVFPFDTFRSISELFPWLQIINAQQKNIFVPEM